MLLFLVAAIRIASSVSIGMQPIDSLSPSAHAAEGFILRCVDRHSTQSIFSSSSGGSLHAVFIWVSMQSLMARILLLLILHRFHRLRGLSPSACSRSLLRRSSDRISSDHSSLSRPHSLPSVTVSSSCPHRRLIIGSHLWIVRSAEFFFG